MNRSGKQVRKISERLLLVLAGAGRDLVLQELADAAGIYRSSARYALERMLERMLVRRHGDRYALAIEGEVVAFELKRAIGLLGRATALELLTSANPAFEFVSVDGGIHAVLSAAADPRDIVRVVALARDYLDMETVTYEAEELLRIALEDEAALARLRHTLSEGRRVKGDLERFPRPGVRGAFAHARPLRRLNQALPRLSRRKLRDLARRYGFSALSVFGSATRPDFRPDSDVDVLIRYAPRTRRTLAATTGLGEELSALLGHRVDLLDEKAVVPSMRANIARDMVRVYGRSRASAFSSGAGEDARTGSDRGARAPR